MSDYSSGFSDHLDNLWGKSDPRRMPAHFFRGQLHLDYGSVLKADVSKQNFTVVPRYWYVDATMPCKQCEAHFCFPAIEQKTWYEDYGFYVDSFPKLCKVCRRELRDLKTLRQEYDRDIVRALANDDCELKVRLATVIDRLCESGDDLPVKVHANRMLLARQIARRSVPGAT